ncbi:MAG: hypothetical protein J6U26_04610, partial [Lachnospiraceae bacterium]|nr:hypothetical protein [Lachnospiraceae bacterium]
QEMEVVWNGNGRLSVFRTNADGEVRIGMMTYTVEDDVMTISEGAVSTMIFRRKPGTEIPKRNSAAAPAGE